MKYIYLSIVLIGLICHLSCKKDKGPITITQESEKIIGFRNDIQPIFNSYCNGPGCHDTFEEAGQLNLSEGFSYNDLVNITSFGFNPDLLVKPNDPYSSVLLQKVNGNSSYNPQMPLFAPKIHDSLVSKIEIWINQGALNN